MKDIDIVWACGHRKCGTTMLLNLFDGHPELCLYPSDLNLLYGFFPVFNDLLADRSKSVSRINKVVFNDPVNLKCWGDHVDADAFKAEFYKQLPDGTFEMQDVICSLLKSYERNRNYGNTFSSYFVKETSIEIYAREISEWFPKSKFIHLIRDPRDNFAAMFRGVERYYGRYGDDEKTLLHSLIERVGTGVGMLDENISAFGESNYHVVKFEDLTGSPDVTLQRVCAFLGIRFDDCLMRPTRFGEPVSGNNFDKQKMFDISTSNVGRWRERISEEAAKVIEFYLGHVLDRFNYERVFSRSEASRAAAEFYKWSNGKYHFFDRFADNSST